MITLMPDELFTAQLLRTVGYASYGGADVGECLATAARISKVDLALWRSEWFALATTVRERAEQSASHGDTTGAQAAYFCAANYFRTAGLFAMSLPVAPTLKESHDLEVESFRCGAALLAVPPRIVAIPCGASRLPGYFFAAGADAIKRPTLILVNGYDGTAEELYFSNGVAALQRGYNVLTFDGPGQGTMLIDQGMPIRPDWEQVISPVIDFALSLPGVDAQRIAVMGLSFGGYLAPRAATAEHRIAACISDCGPYDLFDATSSRLPGFLARQLPFGNRALLSLLDLLARRVMAQPTAGWALRRNLMVHGVDAPLAFFRLTPEYSLKGREQLIQCPTFVCSAEHDDLSVNAQQLYKALTCRKAYRQFKAWDGAGAHCESGARMLFHQYAFDWLDAVLADVSAA